MTPIDTDVTATPFPLEYESKHSVVITITLEIIVCDEICINLKNQSGQHLLSGANHPYRLRHWSSLPH